MIHIYHRIADNQVLALEIEAWNKLGISHGTSFADVPHGARVIPRLCLLPFVQDVTNEITRFGGIPLTSPEEFRFIADIREYSEVLWSLTPDVWNNVYQIPMDYDGPFVIKGTTNSNKFKWRTSMFASTRADIGRVIGNLMNDEFYARQGLVIRPFVNLATYDVEDLSGIPITEEYRFFIYCNEVVGEGFYWVNHLEEILDSIVVDNLARFENSTNLIVDNFVKFENGIRIPVVGGSITSFVESEISVPVVDLNKMKIPDTKSVPLSFINEVIKRVDGASLFYAIDVAHTQDDRWIVIELNDGCMSGLCGVDSLNLWSRIVIAEEVR